MKPLLRVNLPDGAWVEFFRDAYRTMPAPESVVALTLMKLNGELSHAGMNQVFDELARRNLELALALVRAAFSSPA